MTKPVQAAALGAADYGVMLVYFALVVGLGVYFSRKEKNTDDYLLGGRRMPWWVIGVSYMVSLLSTISLVAVPGEAFNNGLTMAYRNLLIPFAAIPAFFIFVRFYFRKRTFTPFSYLEERFDRRVRLLGSLVFWWTRVTYLAMVLYSSAKVFEGAAQWPVWLTITLIGTVGIVYTTLGGMKAVVWTDFTQFIVLAIGLTIIVAKCVGAVDGGAAGIVRYAFAHGRGFEEFGKAEFYAISPYVRLSFWLLTINLFMEFLFYNSADQISIQRLLSTSSYQQAKRSLYLYVALILPVISVLWFLGLAMFAYYDPRPELAEGLTGDKALFRFIATELPAPIPGIVISAMLAAIMSTLDSGMNSLAAVATKDLYAEFIRPDASEPQQVFFSRVMTAAVGVFAVAVALLIAAVSESIKDSIMEVNMIWGAFAGVLAPVFLIGVTTRKVKPNHVLIACIASWLVTCAMVAWYVAAKNTAHPVSFLFVGFPGLLVVLTLGYLPALLPGRIDPEKTQGLTLWTLEAPAPEEEEAS